MMKVAAVQAAPVFLDKAATTDKIVSLIGRAAGGGAQLVAFSETFLPGYPAWTEHTGGAVFDDPGQKAAYAAYLAAAVRADGPEMADIIDAAMGLGVFVYLGLAELAPSQGTVHCSLAAIHPKLGLVSLHRKLMPTYEERLVWGQGDGAGLKVHDYSGWRVGGLNCWENWLPLARAAMYGQGEQLHVAVWPGNSGLTRDISRFIALEGRVWVLSCGGLLTADDIPDDFPLKEAMIEAGGFERTGGSRIVAPNGQVVAEAAEGEEAILIADIDLDMVRGERQNMDPTGHYSRPDVLELKVNRRRLSTLRLEDGNPGRLTDQRWF